MSRVAYASAPLLLNLEPDGHGSFRLASTWCNLGLWPIGPSAPLTFRQACEALAVALGRAAGLAEGDAVLDVGVGYADQTSVWATHFGVRRVLAIEPSASHIAAAREAQASGRLAGGDVVELRVGSAASIEELLRADAQLKGRDVGGACFDVVLCLDCAYHFPSRSAFLQSAARALRPGGRFAAVDLVVASPDERSRTLRWRSLWRTAARRLVAAACDIPSENLHGVDAYNAALVAAGLQPVGVEVLTARVLVPFAAHATAQRRALATELSMAQALFLRVIAALFAFVAWAELFEVVLIRAARPRPRP